MENIEVQVNSIQSLQDTLRSYNIVVLKPNIVDNRNVLTQDMISSKNTKYVIHWNYDLMGDTIYVPSGCLIELEGGSLTNGTIVGNNTVLINESANSHLMCDTSGTWQMETVFEKGEGINSVQQTGTRASATGENSFAVGQDTVASGKEAYAEGDSTQALGNNAHAEGHDTQARGSSSHAEGKGTIAGQSEALGDENDEFYAHAEGEDTQALKYCSHAEGKGTIANGDMSHAGGYASIAKGNSSFASGVEVETNNEGEAAFGKYNASEEDTLFSVGNGNFFGPRKNALEVKKNGDIHFWANDTNYKLQDLYHGKVYLKENMQYVGLHFNRFVDDVPVEDVGISSENINIVYDTVAKKFLAATIIGVQIKYYSAWTGTNSEYYMHPSSEYSYVCDADGLSYFWNDTDLEENPDGEKDKVLTQSMINQSDTIYVVVFDYTLDGQIITIPQNCVLQFEGGSLKNGTLVGNNSKIKAELCEIFKEGDITITGTWAIPEFHLEWAGVKPNDSTFDNSVIVNRVSSINCAISLTTKEDYYFAHPIVFTNNNHLKLDAGTLYFHTFINAACITVDTTRAKNIEINNVFPSDLDGHRDVVGNTNRIGVLIKNCERCTFHLSNIVYFYEAIKLLGTGVGTGGHNGCSYNTFYINDCGSSIHSVRISQDSGGFANENKFIGGSLKMTSDLYTKDPNVLNDVAPYNPEDLYHFYIKGEDTVENGVKTDTYNTCNAIVVDSMSIEGNCTGIYGYNIHSCSFTNNRHENNVNNIKLESGDGKIASENIFLPLYTDTGVEDLDGNGCIGLDARFMKNIGSYRRKFSKKYPLTTKGKYIEVINDKYNSNDVARVVLQYLDSNDTIISTEDTPHPQDWTFYSSIGGYQSPNNQRRVFFKVPNSVIVNNVQKTVAKARLYTTNDNEIVVNIYSLTGNETDGDEPFFNFNPDDVEITQKEFNILNPNCGEVATSGSYDVVYLKNGLLSINSKGKYGTSIPPLAIYNPTDKIADAFGVVIQFKNQKTHLVRFRCSGGVSQNRPYIICKKTFSSEENEYGMEEVQNVKVNCETPFYYNNDSDGTFLTSVESLEDDVIVEAIVPKNIEKLAISLYKARQIIIDYEDAEVVFNDSDVRSINDAGRTIDRPTGENLYIGKSFFDTTLGKPIYWNGTKWVDSDDATADVSRCGTLANKPSSSDIYVGFKYIATDINGGAPIYYTGDANKPWIESDGAEAGVARQGLTAVRQALTGDKVYVGFIFFDQGTNKPYWVQAINSSDNSITWMDADGNDPDA